MNYFGLNSIFFPPYVLSAILITILWIKTQTNSTYRHALELFFSKKMWITKSVFVDVQFSVLIVVFVGYFLTTLQLYVFDKSLSLINSLLEYIAPQVWTFKHSVFTEGIIATIITMVSIDFASFITHRWMHTNAWLRKIHLIHHSAQELNFFTTYRQHIFEPVILISTRTIAAALGLSCFHLFFNSRTPVITYQGMGIGFFIYMFTVCLHHSQIPVRYPNFLRIFLISPHIHHLHHSMHPQHFNKNFGVVFSFWDRFFGSYYDEEVKLNELCFGIENLEENISIKHSISFKLKFKKSLPAATAT